MSEPADDVRRRNRLKWLLWIIVVVVFIGYASLARVHTRLGVKAPTFDKHGRDYVWRIWWRARDDIVDFGSHQVVVVAYVGLPLVFLALCALACWVALVPDDPPVRPRGVSDTAQN